MREGGGFGGTGLVLILTVHVHMSSDEDRDPAEIKAALAMVSHTQKGEKLVTIKHQAHVLEVFTSSLG